MTDTTIVSDAPIDDARPPQHNGAWVAALVTLVGGIVIVSIIMQAALSGLTSGGGARSATYTASVDGVTAIAAEIAASDLVLTFDDVDEATLEVQARGWRADVEWLLEVDNGVLRVSDDRDLWWSWPFGSSSTSAQLVLPQELEGDLTADIGVSAADVIIEGDFGDTRIRVSAGSLQMTGDVSSLDLDVSAGDASATITGEPPSSTTVDVSAGSAVIELPDGTYAVTGEASAGSRTIDVRTDPSSPNTLHVSVSAGDATVTYGD